MISEINIGGGVFLAQAPATAAMALVVTFVIHKLMVLLRLYRLTWHPALFDTALFLCIWTALLRIPLASLLGSPQ